MQPKTCGISSGLTGSPRCWPTRRGGSPTAPARSRRSTSASSRYPTLTLDEIGALPVAEHLVAATAHCYHVGAQRPAAPRGLQVLAAWGFRVQVQHRLAQGPQGWRLRRARRRLLFPQRDRAPPVRHPRAGAPAPCRPGRQSGQSCSQTRKREHSRKPDEQYELIESCAAAAPISSCSAAACARAGPSGATRPMPITSRAWKTYPYNSVELRPNRPSIRRSADAVFHSEALSDRDFPRSRATPRLQIFGPK